MAGVLSHRMSGGGEACLLTLKRGVSSPCALARMRGVICAESDISPRHGDRTCDKVTTFGERHDVEERNEEKLFVRTACTVRSKPVWTSSQPQGKNWNPEKKIAGSPDLCPRESTAMLSRVSIQRRG
jgi:hypothetical protein